MSSALDSIDSELTTTWESNFAKREAGRRSPGGFFAVTGLYWLSSDPVQVPGLPGTWSVIDDIVHINLDPAESLEYDGRILEGEQQLDSIAERGGVHLKVLTSPSSELKVDSVEVARRGGRFILRPKSATHPFLSEYLGTERFDYDPEWRISANYTPFDDPKPVTVGAAVEGIEHIYQAPGEVTFQLGGTEHTLLAFDGFSAGELLVLFRDETSGVSTYAALRALNFSGGPEAGSVTIDFNYAANLPCAYTELATCPLPPAGNHVPVAITAGEKTPRQRVEARSEGPGATWDQIVGS